jgi:tetratricopeptide (TPR) repeat protein
LARSIGNLERQSQALNELAWAKTQAGDFSRGQEAASESWRLAKIAGNLYREADGLRVEAVCLYSLGSYGPSISRLDRAAQLLDLCGMSAGLLQSTIRDSQAQVHCCKSEYVEARNIQTQLLHYYSVDQNPHNHAIALVNVAMIDIEIGAPEHDVQQDIARARLLFQSVNRPIGFTYCDIVRAALYVQEDNLLAAMGLFKKCLQSAWGKNTDTVTYCLEKLASVQQWGPVHQMSFHCRATFLAHSVKSKQRLEIHKALQFLGDWFQVQGDQETATTLFTVALDGFTLMDVHRSKAECMVQLADISELNGDVHRAITLWETARPLLERSSQSKQLVQIEAKLTMHDGLRANPEHDRSSPTHAKSESPSLAMIREIVNEE